MFLSFSGEDFLLQFYGGVAGGLEYDLEIMPGNEVGGGLNLKRGNGDVYFFADLAALNTAGNELGQAVKIGLLRAVPARGRARGRAGASWRS